MVHELAKHIPLTDQQAKEFRDEVTRRGAVTRQDLEKYLHWLYVTNRYAEAWIVRTMISRAFGSSPRFPNS